MKKFGIYSNIDELPKLYQQEEKRGQVMEELWPIMVHKITPIADDMDIVYDFCLHFYEKFSECLKVYERNNRIPFSAFLHVHIRYQFYNFIRYYRRRRVSERLHNEFSCHATENQTAEQAYLSCRAPKPKTRIEDLKPDFQLLAKLYLGIELSICDMQLLMSQVKCPVRVAAFLEGRRLRKERQVDKYEKYKDRSAYLNLLLHRANSQEKIEKLTQKKHRLQKALGSREHLSEVSRLAEFLSVSKSTISRRLNTIARHLRYEA